MRTSFLEDIKRQGMGDPVLLLSSAVVHQLNLLNICFLPLATQRVLTEGKVFMDGYFTLKKAENLV